MHNSIYILYQVVILLVFHYCLSSCRDDNGIKQLMSKSEEIIEDDPESAFIIVDSLMRSGSVTTKVEKTATQPGSQPEPGQVGFGFCWW